MFTAKGLFKTIACPSKETCSVPNCMFSHDLLPAPITKPAKSPETAVSRNRDDLAASNQDDEPRKKLKLSNGQSKEVSHTLVEPTPVRTKLSPGSAGHTTARQIQNVAHPTKALISDLPQSASRKVSPPTDASGSKKRVTSSHNNNASGPKPTISEALNPRMVHTSPARHPIRKALLEKLHEQMVRLNGQAQKSTDPKIKSAVYTKQDLIRLALQEEQRVAEDEPLVYSNVIKHRITALKKISLEDWANTQMAKRSPDDKHTNVSGETGPPARINTGLNSQEEVNLLTRLTADQKGLHEHGYVTTVPTAEEIEVARKGVQSAAGYEQCDRCSSRFQVFPDRRDDGVLTTGGECNHHWGRKRQPPKAKGSTGPSDPVYKCCGDRVGSDPCSKADHHVFKVSEAKRLALITPFIETPFNPNARTDRAVCFDCEMGYTVYGLELIRLTAISWPSGEPILDVLVRPRGTILDLNTRFSGVSREQFSNAPEYDPAKQRNLTDPKNLVLVPSVEAARTLLCDLISSDTPLLGHALENDLNAVRIVHPNIVDSILLFRHPRGLPYRFGLAHLAKQYLKWNIQTGGAAGHDSLEDARATAELIRYQVGKTWTKMREQGWKLEDGKLVEPRLALSTSAAGVAPGSSESSAAVPTGKVRRKKRKLGQIDGADAETEWETDTEPEL